MKTIRDIDQLENSQSILEGYKFQPILTEKLDQTQSNFDQDIINEIVLWKVNRYAQLTDECFRLINNIDRTRPEIDEDLTRKILSNLLSTNGVRLAMASTILRFKAPNIYQIYDQRVFRYIYGIPASNTTIKEKQIENYLKYLKDLRTKCVEAKIDFNTADRVLYQADKIQNKSIPIKY